MKRGFAVVLVLAGLVGTVSRLNGQTPAGGNSGQRSPAGNGQKPATGANPFPEDTSTVPVMPSKTASALPEGTYNGAGSAPIPLAGDDADPVRSPDDPEPAADNGQQENSSSSLSGIDKLLPSPDPDVPDKKGKRAVKEPTHQEAATKDLEVGGYYLETKNWKAALSRFESATVLDPENPDAYWGLAEAERHMGDFAAAKTHYEKVLDFDPDGRHGKEARKVLKEPALANAKSAEASHSAVSEPPK
jgi:hypothetical protein